MSSHDSLAFEGWEWMFAAEASGAPGVIFDPLGSLTFVRGLTPDRRVTTAEMFEAFGLDPATAFDADPHEAYLISVDHPPEPPGYKIDTVRVAAIGEWTVAIEPENIRKRLESLKLSHKGREVFSMTFVTIKGMVDWGYARDGVFQAGGDTQRPPTDGPEAEHFAALLAAAGLPKHTVPAPTPRKDRSSEQELADRQRRGNQEWAENIVGTLAVLGREIGFSLPSEIYSSRLPTTAQRLSPPT